MLILWTAVGLVVSGYVLIPRVKMALDTVSTGDAYINGHVTFVAPRVSGQVATVLVDDNHHVQKGDLLVQLDKEPYQIQVEMKRAAVTSAEADLVAANAQVRGYLAVARANRFMLERTIEDVETQIANLRAAVATLNSKKASLEFSKADLRRGESLFPSGSMSKKELDQRQQAVKVDEAAVEQALQQVYAIRAGLGLSAKPFDGQALTDVPPDLGQHFSSVRQELGTLLHSAAQFGYFPSTWDTTPKKALEEFYMQDKERNLDNIFAHIIPNAPVIKQAEAKLMQTRRDLDQAELNLRYCDVVSEIDGVVIHRNVNPGNYVQAGQSLMAVCSLTEIWIDANFKETQLAHLRIGHRVRCEVRKYGSRNVLEGRITGFTIRTGQSFAPPPPENATGNFVNIVQPLTVRIELTNNKQPMTPLLLGLSVTPYVYYKEPPTGPQAGDVLQPLVYLPAGPTTLERGRRR